MLGLNIIYFSNPNAIRRQAASSHSFLSSAVSLDIFLLNQITIFKMNEKTQAGEMAYAKTTEYFPSKH